ncbi:MULTISPECIES: amidohydrolase family protein [Anaerotruncus]|uniref:amidohydrolase family protein n=1 Tax=Anaerotruncus TaxID=244127 RepID=UPI00082E2160|nr:MULTISPECIES: amidohydrolase family protein [Anaerotruncus]RGX55795.1 amidohydrolase [Anaerotruncus sp. AF02-27]
MKIIDAHLHFCRAEYFDGIAAAAGHENTAEHLSEQYGKLGIVHGVVMGNRGLSAQGDYPPFLSYCVGLDEERLREESYQQTVEQVQLHLQRKNCVGIKLYPGYNSTYVTDQIYAPFYELAARYQKPVAIHTGATAGKGALLKYSHPLTLDELAVRYPQVQFVMCHFGNPWLVDAAAVLEKNDNVAVDLSGLLEGRVNPCAFFAENGGYVEQLRIWMKYADCYDRVMFGTDWPLVNLKEYIAFIGRLVPERFQEDIFFGNANRIYQLGL